MSAVAVSCGAKLMCAWTVMGNCSAANCQKGCTQLSGAKTESCSKLQPTGMQIRYTGYLTGSMLTSILVRPDSIATLAIKPNNASSNAHKLQAQGRLAPKGRGVSNIAYKKILYIGINVVEND